MLLCARVRWKNYYLVSCSRCFWVFLLPSLLILLGAKCWMLPPTDDCNLSSREPLDPPPTPTPLLVVGGWGEGGPVNELPSVPRVKGTCKLTAAFVRALIGFFQSPPPPPAPPFSPSTCLLHAPAAPWQEQRRLALERRSLSARFMFRISRLMRTKEINWWFKPNETSVKLTGLINGNK